MDTVYYGFVPLPEEGTEAADILETAEGCTVTVCRGDAYDPYEAAALYGHEPWCPGHCARYVELTRHLVKGGR